MTLSRQRLSGVTFRVYCSTSLLTLSFKYKLEWTLCWNMFYGQIFQSTIISKKILKLEIALIELVSGVRSGVVHVWYSVYFSFLFLRPLKYGVWCVWKDESFMKEIDWEVFFLNTLVKKYIYNWISDQNLNFLIKRNVKLTLVKSWNFLFINWSE